MAIHEHLFEAGEVKQNEYAINHLAPDLLADHELIFEAGEVKQDRYALNHLAPNLMADHNRSG